jgi:peptidoglycan hydrolase-like protein with peptidoglycan-binding domain
MYYPQDNYPSRPADSIAASVQERLAQVGYYHGAVDGNVGPLTRAAIALYQNNHRLPVTRRIDESLLQSLGLL